MILILVSGLFIVIFYHYCSYHTRFTNSSHLLTLRRTGSSLLDNTSLRRYPIGRFKRLRGIALVIHGLNLKPEKMESIIFILNALGIEVINLSLHGHGRNYVAKNNNDPDAQRLESFRTVTYETWSEEAYMAYQTVRKKAHQRKVPLYFIGYSLGALIGCDLLVSRDDVYFDRMILFAPALHVTIKRYLLKPLLPFPSVVIDSLSPESYRSNPGTPMAAYKALFDAIEHFETHMNEKLNIPTIIFVDEKDEMISFSRLSEMIHEKNFDRWTIHLVQKDENVDKKVAAHLIIDRTSTGENMWKQIEYAIRKHVLH